MAVRDATGIFLTGGNQLRLSSTIGGTLLAEAMVSKGSALQIGTRGIEGIALMRAGYALRDEPSAGVRLGA